MIDSALLARVRLEPLDRKKHDRAAFSCGEIRIDNFLKNTASKLQDNDVTRVQVACLDQSDEIVGFYALNSHAVDVSSLPETARKRLPRYDSVGAIFLSMVGVDLRHQQSGLGSLLMAHAFKRCAEVADLVGAYFIVLDAVNERAAKLYRRLGFESLPGQAPRMLITLKQVRRAIELSANDKSK